MVTTKTNDSLIPAVSYVRMSGDKQEDSPEQQRAEIAKLAERGGYRLIHEYFDPAVSGDATEKRAAFLEMREAAASGTFQVILAWDTSRFGRFDIIDAGHWIRPFKLAGVSLVTVAEGPCDWENLTGQLLYSVQQMGKHAFLRDLSRNITRGQLAGAARGEWQGGPAPYGYQLQPMPDAPVRKNGTRPTCLVADPATAPVVRRIFRLFLDGASTREIASQLNSERTSSPSGVAWSFSGVCSLLRKRAYIGEYRFGDHPSGKYHRCFAAGLVAVKNGDGAAAADPVVIPDHYEALVSVANFDRVQALLKDRNRQTTPYRRGDNPFLLSSLLKCGHCGAPLIGNCNAGYVATYVCGGYSQKGLTVCRRHFVRENEVVDVLVRKLQDTFLEESNLAELRNEIRRQLAPSAPTSSADTGRLQARIEKLSKQIDKGAEKLLTAPADLTSILTAKLQSWQKERDELQRQAGTHRTAPGATETDVEEIIGEAIGELQALRERLAEADPALLRNVLRQLVARVEFWFDWKTAKGRKRPFPVVRRGLIHVRPDLRIVKLVQGVRALQTSLTIPFSGKDIRKQAA
jgi:DNA invertase Pin-like site-specific DNA recombinase